MRNLKMLSKFYFILLLIVPSVTQAMEIVWEGELLCNEISAKSFSVNGEISNVKMDGESLEVIVDGNTMTTRFPSLSTKTNYKHVVSLMHKDANGNQILNSQFVAEHGGMFGTRTVTITYQQATGYFFMISTEPFALGTDFPAVRTHFHQCKPIKS